MTAAHEPETPMRSRRALLAAALGGLGAFAAAVAHPERVRGASGDIMYIGTDMTGENVTKLTRAGGGTALLAVSATGIGLYGSSSSGGH